MKEKKKSKNGCEMNFKGRFSEELPWRVVIQFTSKGPMNCFGELLRKFTSEGCPLDFTKTQYYVFKNKNLCFENSVFSILV